jgi:hypothetical protein
VARYNAARFEVQLVAELVNYFPPPRESAFDRTLDFTSFSPLWPQT